MNLDSGTDRHGRLPEDLHRAGQKGNQMRHSFLHVALAVVAAAAITRVPTPIAPARLVLAQGPAYSTTPSQRYPFPAATPEDAYRDGVINRWELQHYEGPLPQALQGPSVNGNRGNNDGGDGRQ